MFSIGPFINKNKGLLIGAVDSTAFSVAKIIEYKVHQVYIYILFLFKSRPQLN